MKDERWCIKATHPSVISIYSFQVLKSSNAYFIAAVLKLFSCPGCLKEQVVQWSAGKHRAETHLRGRKVLHVSCISTEGNYAQTGKGLWVWRWWIMFLYWQTQRLYTLKLPQKKQKNILRDPFHLLKLTLTTKKEINGMDKYLQQKPKWWPPSRWCRTRRSASPRSACQRMWRSLRCKLPKPTELENLAIGVKLGFQCPANDSKQTKNYSLYIL